MVNKIPDPYRRVPKEITEEFALPLIKELLELIGQNLPEVFDPAILTRKSRTPYHGFTAREILIHRVHDLASGAMALHESRNVIGSCVLIRALIETVALSYLTLNNTQFYPKTKTGEQLHEFYAGVLLGSRDGTTDVPAKNVLTAIDHMDDEFPGVRRMYDGLSEVAHPNWGGLLGVYGEHSYENVWLELTEAHTRLPAAVGLAPFAGVISVFIKIYNDLGDDLMRVSDHFDQNH